MSQSYFGSCLCGTNKFEVIGDFNSFYLCHCSYCQKDTGSFHGANLFSMDAQLKWHSAFDCVKIFNLPDTRHTKAFCTECGSALPYTMNETVVVTPAGALDSKFDMKPNAHLFCKSRNQWDNNLELLPKFDTFPE
ncbi:S-(hydroxymethyl)glutathione synthase [Bacteriovorax sp. BSW11_IV]|uniref:GFA family protein n=1 Tax=Bacteriovorax sp. BSW11_IV TaxID=1353529 RepID=UPI00038A5039|nr:GFA family protein [Bacteriovorax sp. BSW11_IV]EQC44599.1 S-(hydroxymethyl)glutathione synthase [Bacteriovorax sp. BSW11_IV]